MDKSLKLAIMGRSSTDVPAQPGDRMRSLLTPGRDDAAVPARLSHFILSFHIKLKLDTVLLTPAHDCS
jgi:hypothetical protein